MRDPECENSVHEMEVEALKAFLLVLKNFIGNNKKAKNYEELVTIVLTAFRSMSDEQGKTLHQDVKEIETRHTGRGEPSR